MQFCVSVIVVCGFAAWFLCDLGLFGLFIRVDVLCLVLSGFALLRIWLFVCLQFGLAARRLCWFALRWCLFSGGYMVTCFRVWVC